MAPSLLTKDRFAAARQEAAFALGQIGNSVRLARPALQKAAKDDEDDTVRREAQDAIKRIDSGKRWRRPLAYEWQTGCRDHQAETDFLEPLTKGATP